MGGAGKGRWEAQGRGIGCRKVHNWTGLFEGARTRQHREEKWTGLFVGAFWRREGAAAPAGAEACCCVRPVADATG